MTDLAAGLKTIRDRVGFTQAEMGQQLGKTQVTVATAPST
jgi:DNA-binding XRE family transcriptional regulator